MFEKLQPWELQGLIDKIKQGAVVIFPTDTVYAIGCSMAVPAAIDRLYKITGHTEDDQLTVLATVDQVEQMTETVKQEKLAMQQFWPGNLTILLEANGKYDRRLIRQGKLALRVPDVAPLQELFNLCGPLVAVGANLSGQPSPVSLQELSPLLMQEADLILGELTGSGELSTVVSWNRQQNRWELLQEGQLKLSELL